MKLLLALRKSAAGRWLALGGTGWLLAGCLAALPAEYQSNAVTFAAYEAAEIFLAPAARQVLVINRFDAGQLPYSKERKTEIFRAGAAEALATVVRELSFEPTFRLERRDTLVRATAKVAPPLPAAEVQALCRRGQAQSLLALEGFEATMRQDDVEKETSSDGTITRTAFYSLVVRTHWGLYDAQGKLLHQSKAEVAEPYDKRQVHSGLLALGPALANAGDRLHVLAGLAAAQYARRYTPKHISLRRDYYVGRELQAAADHLQQSDWLAAAALLKPLAAGPDAKLASQAAYNLSVAHEATSNLAEALHWAMQAEQLSPGDKHARRVQVVLQRQQAVAALQAQQPIATEGAKP